MFKPNKPLVYNPGSVLFYRHSWCGDAGAIGSCC